LKSIKTSYAEHIGSDRLVEVVRGLMKEQHKTMFIALRDGQFDHVFVGDPPPVQLPSGGSIVPGLSMLPGGSMLPATTGAGAVAAAGSLPVASGLLRAPSVVAEAPGESLPVSEALLPPPSPVPGVVSGSPSEPPPWVASPAVTPAVTVGAAAPSRSLQRREAPELFALMPSDVPPVNVVEQAGAPPSVAPPALEPAKKDKPGWGRYAASRPAAIFGSTRNPESGGSIFGDDLISEKSLDEVILSYLSDDLDPTSKK
jgi:hypothetical protein